MFKIQLKYINDFNDLINQLRDHILKKKIIYKLFPNFPLSSAVSLPEENKLYVTLIVFWFNTLIQCDFFFMNLLKTYKYS